MALPGWRYVSEKVLADKVGVMSGLLMQECISELGVPEHDITASHFLQFVRLLYEKLPTTIDRRALCQELQATVLQTYGFNKK